MSQPLLKGSGSLQASSHQAATAASSSLKSVLLNFLQHYHCGNSECKYYHEEHPLDRPLIEEKLDSGEGICLKCYSCEEWLYPCECCSQLFGGVHPNMNTNNGSNNHQLENNHQQDSVNESKEMMIKFCSFCSFPNVVHYEWRRRLSDLMCSEQDDLESLKFVQMQLVEFSLLEEQSEAPSLTDQQASSLTSCEKQYFKHLEGMLSNDNKLLGELFYATPISISAALKKSVALLTEPKALFTNADFKMLRSLYDETDDSTVKVLLENIETHFIKNEMLHSLLENIKLYILSSVNFSLIPHGSRHGIVKSIFNNQFTLMMESLQLEFHSHLYPKILEPMNDHFVTLTRSHMHQNCSDNVTQQDLTQQKQLKTSNHSFFVYPFSKEQTSIHRNKDAIVLFEKRFKLWRQLYFHLCYVNHLLSLSCFGNFY